MVQAASLAPLASAAVPRLRPAYDHAHTVKEVHRSHVIRFMGRSFGTKSLGVSCINKDLTIVVLKAVFVSYKYIFPQATMIRR